MLLLTPVLWVWAEGGFACKISGMSGDALRDFVGKVLAIDAGYSGMGGATSGIVGSASTETAVILDLRKNVLAFAAEYTKPDPDPARLTHAAHLLEGSFLSLHTITAASEQRLDWLLGELQKLMHAADRRS